MFNKTRYIVLSYQFYFSLKNQVLKGLISEPIGFKSAIIDKKMDDNQLLKHR